LVTVVTGFFEIKADIFGGFGLSRYLEDLGLAGERIICIEIGLTGWANRCSEP
jgi:hypothetical protein